MANTGHKDRLFKFIFGNPDHKEWTLSLYNALNGTSYSNPEDIEFNTLEDVIYMGMKNDVSFIIMDAVNLWEHQSTFNPNMPIRFFIYAGHLYEKHISSIRFSRFSGRLQKLPKPKCICFYNGKDEQPEERILRLSEAYGSGDGDIEVSVKMLNINYGRNMSLMKSCMMLEGYALLIASIRRNQRVMKNLDVAIDAAIDEMPNEFELKKFLLTHRAEVKGMYLTEYDEEKERELLREEFREEGFEEGREEGRMEGISDTNKRVASDMLKKHLPLTLIEEISQLSEEVIRTIADRLGITVA